MPYPTSAEIALMRSKQRNFSRTYLGVQKGKERTDDPPPLMVGQHYALTGADTYSGANYTLTFAANFLLGTDIRNGMTLGVGTLADPFLYGSVRIRVVDVGNNRLCLEQNDLGTLGHLATGDYIWVDGVYRLYRKLPRIVNGVIYEDGADSGGGAGIPGDGVGWNANYYDRPVALMGSPRFAWQGEPNNFYGWRSYGRGGATIASYAWAFDSGVVAGGADVTSAGTPAAPVIVTWNAAGEYVASLTVSDSGAGGNDAYGVPYTDHRAVRPVLVYDKPGEGPNPPYTNFQVESLSGKYGSGWTARIKVFGTADKSEFPDNAMVILFAEDFYGDTKQSIGGWYGQEGVLFVGHIRGDSVQVDYEKSTVTFDAQTIEQWMKDINVWPGNFSDPTGAADEWREFDDMVVEDVLWHLAEFSSNLKDVTDCFFSAGEKALHFLDLTEGSLYDQMSGQTGSCFFGQVSASRQGSIHLFKHKNMLTLPERLVWGWPLLTFTTQDWRGELKIGEERQRDSVAQVDFIGFIYDAGGNPQEVYSLAPLRQLNFGTIEKVTGTLLTGQTIGAAQAENDTLSGLYLAWKNIRFPHLGVPAFNNRVLEPATQDYFAVDLAAADTIRGYDWDGKEWLTMGMSIDIDNENGIIVANIEAEASTWGPDGVAGEYPPGGIPPVPEYGGGGGPGGYTPLPPPEGEPADGSLYYFIDYTTGRLYRSRNARDPVAANVVYENCGVIGANPRFLILNPWDPKNSAMAVCYHAVYRTDNLDDATPTWTLVLNLPAPSYLWHGAASICQNGLWVVTGFWNNVGPGEWFPRGWVSIDGGINWTAFWYTPGVEGRWTKIELSSHDCTKAFAMVFNSVGGLCRAATSTNINGGAPTWSLTTLWNTASDPPMVNPYHRYFNNPSDQYALWAGEQGNAPVSARTYFCTADQTGCTQATLDATGVTWCGGYTWGSQSYWVATEGDFYISTDAINWVARGVIHPHVSGWPYDGNKFYATNHGAAHPLEISDDWGVTWQDQTGNWAAVGVNGTILCGVAVWVA